MYKMLVKMRYMINVLVEQSYEKKTQTSKNRIMQNINNQYKQALQKFFNTDFNAINSYCINEYYFTFSLKT